MNNGKETEGCKSVAKSMGGSAALADGEPKARHNEWGFSCKMLDLTRHIDSVRNAK